MSESKKLTYLLKLLDDDSPLVRKSVVAELISFGHNLHESLSQLTPPPTLWQRQQLQELMEDHNRHLLRRYWPSWFEIQDEFKKLERALDLICEFQTGLVFNVTLGSLLDDLAEEFRRTVRPLDVYELAQFLFKAKGLRGDQDDYYNPFNSSLIHVIKEKRGIPISLCCVYMLVGARLGFSIEGCNLPGHFMAKTVFHGQKILVDCFNGGRFLDPKEVVKVNMEMVAEIRQIIDKKTTTEMIIIRVLTNLARAYEGVHNLQSSQLMIDLTRLTENFRIKA